MPFASPWHPAGNGPRRRSARRASAFSDSSASADLVDAFAHAAQSQIPVRYHTSKAPIPCGTLHGRMPEHCETGTSPLRKCHEQGHPAPHGVRSIGPPDADEYAVSAGRRRSLFSASPARTDSSVITDFGCRIRIVTAGRRASLRAEVCNAVQIDHDSRACDRRALRRCALVRQFRLRPGNDALGGDHVHERAPRRRRHHRRGDSVQCIELLRHRGSADAGPRGGGLVEAPARRRSHHAT